MELTYLIQHRWHFGNAGETSTKQFVVLRLADSGQKRETPTGHEPPVLNQVCQYQTEADWRGDMTNLQLLTVAFSALSNTELRRLKSYEESGKKFLCGAASAVYCCGGLG